MRTVQVYYLIKADKTQTIVRMGYCAVYDII